MLAILKKELRLFFGSLGAYTIILGFLIINGLWLWVLKTDANILDSGFANLSNFFHSTAWLFILVIPALTMKSFSEEYISGTIEIIKTKPIGNLEFVLGKFFSILIIIGFMLSPTLIYVFSIYELATPVGSIEIGSIIGSYLGLFLLASSFIAIGLWISSWTKNILISLLSSVFVSFIIYSGLSDLNSLLPGLNLDSFSLSVHFISIARGVVDTADLVYFLVVTIFFCQCAVFSLSSIRSKKKIASLILISVSLVGLSNSFHNRFDLTSDQKYTLSPASESILATLDENAVIKVYLEGDFPPKFKRLQTETKQFLEELKMINDKIKVLFIDPKEQLQKLTAKGLSPSRLTIEENGVVSESVIIPWATLSYKNKQENISLLKDGDPKDTQEQQLENSIQNLEYAFLHAVKNISSKKEKSIAILSGNGELEDIYLYSLLKSIGSNYHLAKFTLDSVQTNPLKTVEHIKSFDLALIAKPTTAFTEEEKYTIDQYILNGGRSLWMLDNVQAEMDSLFQNGKTLAYSKNLNLDDFFFRYGARVNQNLVKDLYASKIALATGNTGNKTNFENFLWFYAPLVSSKTDHPIVNNISPVSLSFVSSIDTLKNDVKKTILLQSSLLSKEVQVPTIIELNSVMENPDPKTYKNGSKILGLLLEGNFTSAYKDRIKPLQVPNALEKGNNNKMILIADGNIGKNQIHKGKPLELGVDKWTQQYYGNKEFLSNAIEYLLDDTGLIRIRSKKINLRLLNKQKVFENKTYWQLFNLFGPILMVSIIGFILHLRKKKLYSTPKS